MATYWYRYTLLTPRNGRRKFRSPVHSPSGVLTWTSRTPSPSSSRAHSRTAWQTVARSRPIAGSPLYPCHSSVLTLAIGQLAFRTTRRRVASSECSVTVSRTCPLSRPTTPQTGGRSLSQVPWPRALFPRRRGGSSGSVCGTPFFPRALVGLVGLQHALTPRHPGAVAPGPRLQAMPQRQRRRAVAAQLAGELGGGGALGEPADDQDQLAGPALGAVEGRAGEGVEHPTAVAAAIVPHRGAVAAVDAHPVGPATARADQPVGMEPLDQLGVAGALVHQVGDREVHGRSPPA